jgi:colicin import membrane protein
MTAQVLKVRPADEPEAEVSAGELVVFNTNPVAVLTDPERFDRFYNDVKREADKLQIDLTTAKGRAAIKSMAHKVAKTKVLIDDAGKKLNEEARAHINKVDEARRRIRDRLDALRDEIRQPLTEWEEREAARVDACNKVMDRLGAVTVITIDDTAETVAGRLAEVEAVEIGEEQFKELLGLAESLKSNALTLLQAALARLTKEEADRAELERLRAAEAERVAREAAERAERERLEREAEEARLAKIRAEEAAAAEAKRLEEAAEAARQEALRQAERARQAAEARIQQEREAAERAAAEERRKAEEAHAAELARVQREKDALIAQQEAEKRRHEAEAKTQREADEARARDREHRSKIMGEVKAALMEGSAKLAEATAKKVVLAICAGEIAHVSVKF